MTHSRLFAVIGHLAAGIAAAFLLLGSAHARDVRAPVTAQTQMVAAANPHAAEAGREILRAGGSAVDAAVAMQMVLTLVEPQSSGIGGGAFLLHWSAQDGALDAWDGREKAPEAATPDLFLDDQGQPLKFFDALVGGRAVGVPGALAMLAAAHERQGNLPWADLFQPAIRLARSGFEVSQRLHDAIVAGRDLIASRTAAATYFLDATGDPLPVGHVLRNAALADTLSQIAEKGPRAFYEGEIARKIVAAVQGDVGNPGRLEMSDMAAYRPVLREAVCAPYRAHRVCGMPPPTSGGIAVLQMLGVLQRFDLAALDPVSAETAHLIAEAGRLAFADRNLYVADPDYVEVPVDALLDRGYLARRSALISVDASMGKATAGRPLDRADLVPGAGFDVPSTSHLVAVDADGNVVSMTTSVEFRFGSHLMVGGFLLNNQLTDFSFRPLDADGRVVANAVQPGKRPRSSMSPTIAFDEAGKPVLAVGSPGGSRIPGYTLRALLGVLDWDLDPQAALDLPHVVNRNGATDLEAGTAAEALAPALESKGHEVRVVEMTSGLHAIAIGTDGTLTGAADRRREGVALGD
ncbi:gamma-glutamyltransferase [Futiania mangrovi]|uniref:Glutathione hydrolase proenzyme n=1 Tax=Futiania mangrovi TaxID=2959716 RepID=A0A9J6PEC7_9PROT|nr:gamma-glutamyltransferase [Futiania mangrovii]MCP1337773.1 gamma-glutamyltransferase [Futiania mangrovii]